MPLKLNVGLSRKIGEANYGSRGASVNVELELDSSLISEPGRLQDRIRQLFGLVKTSLAEELNGGQPNQSSRGYDGAPQNPSNGGNGSKESPLRPATPSQVKAIYAIAKNQGLNVYQLLRQRFQVGRPDGLTLRQASQLIDDLKKSADQSDG